MKIRGLLMKLTSNFLLSPFVVPQYTTFSYILKTSIKYCVTVYEEIYP
jgi:hypothetical protein